MGIGRDSIIELWRHSHRLNKQPRRSPRLQDPVSVYPANVKPTAILDFFFHFPPQITTNMRPRFIRVSPINSNKRIIFFE